MEEGARNFLAQVGNLWCVMDFKHSKCVLIVKWKQLGWLWCGAQGVN
jgi:hypothetical protein